MTRPSSPGQPGRACGTSLYSYAFSPPFASGATPPGQPGNERKREGTQSHPSPPSQETTTPGDRNQLRLLIWRVAARPGVGLGPHAGCGTGRVTEHLLRRLPDGRVIALDASDAMLTEAARRLAAFGDRVQYVRADLGQPLPFDQQVDAVFSTAVFHWVPDHDALFANLAAMLRPSGTLVAQCGGTGNVASVMAAAAALGRPLAADTINFPS